MLRGAVPETYQRVELVPAEIANQLSRFRRSFPFLPPAAGEKLPVLGLDPIQLSQPPCSAYEAKHVHAINEDARGVMFSNFDVPVSYQDWRRAISDSTNLVSGGFMAYSVVPQRSKQ